MQFVVYQTYFHTFRKKWHRNFNMAEELLMLSNGSNPDPHINIVCDAVRGTQVNILRDQFFSGVHIIFLVNVVFWLLSIFLFSFIRKYAFCDEDKVISNSAPEVHYPKLFQWISTTYYLSEDHFYEKCGASAVQYLRFQKFIWEILFWITFFSMILVLPANLAGTMYEEAKSFGRTTIGNLSPESPLIWVHALAACCFIYIGFRLTKFFRRSTIANERENFNNHCDILLISDLPEFEQKSVSDYCKEIRSHIETAYQCQVFDVQFAFDYSDCIEHFEKITALHTGLELNELVTRCPDERTEFEAELETKKQTFLEKLEKMQRLPVAFVQLSKGKRVFEDFNHGLGSPAKSPFFQRLRVEHWNVEKSTDPDDIFWSGLAQRCSSLYWLRTVFINCALFIIMLFFTTPSIAVNNIEKLKWLGIDFNFTQIIDIPSFSWFSNFLPTLMLWTFAAIHFFP